MTFWGEDKFALLLDGDNNSMALTIGIDLRNRQSTFRMRGTLGTM